MTSTKKKILQNKNLTELERVLIESFKDEMVTYMKKKPEKIVELVELAILDKEHLSWRAAYILNTVMKKKDARVQPKTNDVINAIANKPDGHRRELLKILLKLELSEEQESRLVDICISLWKDIDTKPSVRFYAFRMLMSIAEKYPDLENEIRLLTSDLYMDSLSQGIRRVIKKRLHFGSAQ